MVIDVVGITVDKVEFSHGDGTLERARDSRSQVDLLVMAFCDHSP